MRIYPAIDIKDGHCVRLLQGRFADETIYGDDPAAQAKKWESLGGEYIHVVDLDGARSGLGKNAEVIKKICASVSVPVQTGGGIRSLEDIEARIDSGVSRVIIGTKAVSDKNFVKAAVEKYGEKIVIGIDAKNGFVATDGWEKTSGFTAVGFAKEMEALGVQTIVYTDIATDGTLKGPNVPAMTEMAASVKCNVIASGGIGSVSDIRSLKDSGVEGIIIGRALYTKNIALPEAVSAAKKSEKG